MSQNLISITLRFLSVISVGLAVKIMDDDQDREYDRILGSFNLTEKLKAAALPYSLALLTVSLLLDKSLGGSLFIASYCLGMADCLHERLVLGLPAWAEAAGFALFGAVLLGIPEMVTSFCLVLAVVIFDDFTDLDRDIPCFNFVRMLGFYPSCLLILWAILTSGTIDLEKTLLVLLGAVLLQLGLRRGALIC